MIESLTKAIIAKFESSTASGSAYDLVDGRFYNHEAPQTAAFPYIVFFIVSVSHDLILGPKDHDTARVQFSIFSDKRNSIAELVSIDAQIRSLYDEASLDFSGTSSDYTSVMVKRDTTTYHKANDVWQETIDYLMTCQEN